MIRPPRVLVLDQAPGVWGAQQYLLRLGASLRDIGFDVVLGGRPELDIAQEWAARGWPFASVRLPLTRSVRSGTNSRPHPALVLREVVRLVAGAGRIGYAARRAGAGVIVANGHAVHLEVAIAGRLVGLPTVLHLHEEMTHGVGQLLRGAAVRLATQTIAVSNAVADGLPKRLRERVRVIANGVDTDVFHPGTVSPDLRASMGVGADELCVVAVTRLDPEKRVQDLLEAMRTFTDRPDWHLTIVGSTSAYPEYEQSVRELAAQLLPGRVTFTGRRADVPDMLRTADLLVHAGVVEGMPLNLLEAQASGCPVVAYDVAGVGEAVAAGRTGLLAPAGSVAQLRAHVGTLLADARARTEMGAAAREYVAEFHSWPAQVQANADQLFKVLRREPLTTRTSAPKVVLANHWHDDNRGDSAISQGILTLLRQAAPECEVTVTTLGERGAAWPTAVRHLRRFWPDLQAVPSPLPTELRGRMKPRSRGVILVDASLWWMRLLPSVLGLIGLPGPSPWRRVIHGSDLVVLVGGSNIFDDRGVPGGLSVPRLATVLGPVVAANRAGTPVALLGHTLGPFSRRSGEALARRVLNGADLLVVREEKSTRVASDLGISAVEEAPDMAFAIEPELSEQVSEVLGTLPAAPGRILVLSARQHPTLGRSADQRLVQVFAAAARTLIHAGAVEGVAVVAHTMGPTPIEDDRPISRELAASLGDVPCVLVEADLTPAEMSAFYGAVAVVVGVRLHASILALNAGTPTFAVSYLTAKTQGVMTQVGLPDAVAEFATVSAGQLVDGVQALLAEPALRTTLQERADARRAELFRAAERWFAPLTERSKVAARG